MEEAVVAEMAIVLEDALFCLQCLPLLASDKLTLEHRTSKTRRSRKTLEWMAGWLAPRVMGCGKHAKKIQHIPLGKWKGFVTGRSGRTNCRYRTREKGPPIPSCPTPLHPNINKATNLSSLVFAIMYMAKIVVTGQELLSKLTVSSLGWKKTSVTRTPPRVKEWENQHVSVLKTSGRGGRQEALIFSDTCYSFHLKCRNPVHKSKSFDQDRRLDEPLNAMKKIA
uniref:Uncharacterized protein n=1 Tax=Oryza glumipatula TaxID=40148 RepID=A0A0E0A377_9ORYZ